MRGLQHFEREHRAVAERRFAAAGPADDFRKMAMSFYHDDRPKARAPRALAQQAPARGTAAVPRHTM